MTILFLYLVTLGFWPVQFGRILKTQFAHPRATVFPFYR